MSIRTVIAEDSLLVREGLERLLARFPEVVTVAVVADLPSLLAAVGELQPDLVITDVRMPPTNCDEGIAAANVLRGTHPDVAVLVLSQYVEPAWVMSLLEGGSARRGYLLKERVAAPDQLVRAIRDVAAGGSVIDPLVIESLVTAKSRVSESRLARLTPRELDVLGQIAQGKNNAAVADALVLSHRAVEKHINSVFQKLDLTEEAEIHRRVMAVLVYLSDGQDTTGTRPGPGGQG
jgi:DNA-binding NarL/FixJ family response regulator